MAAFFFPASQNKGLFLQGRILYMCYSLFQIESWGKTRTNNEFLSCLKCIYMFSFIYTRQVSLE